MLNVMIEYVSLQAVKCLKRKFAHVNLSGNLFKVGKLLHVEIFQV